MSLLIPLYVCLAIPLAASLAIALFTRKNEWATSIIARGSIKALFASTLWLISTWIYQGAGAREFDLGILYQNRDYIFDLVLLFDKNSAVFSFMTVFLSLIIVKYCRYYLHREKGFARFFSTIFAFIFGMQVLVFSGTLDVFFAGWEIVGISSFLLIGFYRERRAPIQNAMRVYAVYRFCDTGVLLGAWLGHLIWHHSEHFTQMTAASIQGLSHGSVLGLCLLILLAAAGKSAQFPFCFWLPRAMEGPTPSSAIFYGALSIHAGVFLLIRTFPIWSSISEGQLAVGLVGSLSVLTATFSGRVQSNIKAQIAYASITQVGLMLVELALGFPTLALFHFVCNATLRCYQLLISPSVVAHLLRLHGTPGGKSKISDWSWDMWLPQSWRHALYRFGLSDGYLELGLSELLLEPLKALGRLFRNHITLKVSSGIFTVVLIGALAMWSKGTLPSRPMIVVVVTTLLVSIFRAFAERESALVCWNLLFLSFLLKGCAVLSVDPAALEDVVIYYSGIIPSWLVGFIALKQIGDADIFSLHGKAMQSPGWSAVLFFASLGIIGFPIGPTFLGVDLLLHHAARGHLWLAALVSAGFVINGITVMRLFSCVCLGEKNPLPLREGPRSQS